MAPLAPEKAQSFWRGVAEGVAAGERLLLVAEGPGTGQVLGTVQLVLAQPDNQPHRADLSKMLVRSSARRRGIGEALMRTVEEEARAAGKTLLVLDTASADAERLYERSGWVRVGAVPATHSCPTAGSATRSSSTSSSPERPQRDRERRRYFGCMRSAPSRRMTSPFSIGFAMMDMASMANSSGLPRRDGKGTARRGCPAPPAAAAQHGSLEDAGRDRADPDTGGGEFARGRQRQPDHPGLGRRIGGLADLPLIGGDGRRRDHDPALAASRGSSAIAPAATSRIMLNVPIRLMATTRA
jgi:GNAT superfamily N-acetyltransferase